MSDELQKTRVMPALTGLAAATERLDAATGTPDAATEQPARAFWRRPWVIGMIAVLVAFGAANGGTTDPDEVADSAPAPFSLAAPATSPSAVPTTPAPSAVPTSGSVAVVPAPAPSPATTSTPAPAPAPRPTPAPAPAPVAVAAPAPISVVYRNCDDVRAHGAAPIQLGDPGWQPKFDADDDGVGCE